MPRRGGGCPGVTIRQGGGALPCSCLCGNHVWEWGLCHATWQVRSFGAGLPRWLVVLALLPVGPVPRLVSVGPVRRVWGARSSARSVFDCEGFVHGTSSSDVWQSCSGSQRLPRLVAIGTRSRRRSTRGTAHWLGPSCGGVCNRSCRGIGHTSDCALLLGIH